MRAEPALDEYENPLVSRYASREMSRIFSPQFKFSTWRRLWVWLAEAQRELGLDIAEDQVEALRTHVDAIDFEEARRRERDLRHDVMAHVHTFAGQCPSAAGILHLGATSCYVTDNTELIQIRAALELVHARLLGCLRALRDFVGSNKNAPTLGFTHFQPAQLTTVGKRACGWLQDLLLDSAELDWVADRLPFRGVKGATGTQSSFLRLFDGDHGKVRRLDQMVTAKAGFRTKLTITGQTYTRKIDSRVHFLLNQIAQSLAKFATDLRLLQHLKEVEEPFEASQVGSSAMAYKRNPMRCERICSLARFVQGQDYGAVFTASTQWLERTLDDSANRRLGMPQAFLATDAMLLLAENVMEGLVVHPRVIRRRIDAELPFLATENILMESVKRGGNRQALHEAIRRHSLAAARRVVDDGLENDLLERIAGDSRFALNRAEIQELLDPTEFTGRAAALVDEFLEEELDPYLDKNRNKIRSRDEDIRV